MPTIPSFLNFAKTQGWSLIGNLPFMVGVKVRVGKTPQRKSIKVEVRVRFTASVTVEIGLELRLTL